MAPRNENPQTARGCGCAAGGAETTRLRRSSRFKVDAFSFAEIVVVVAILAVLLTFVLVGVARARASARSAQCVNNLRQIGQAFQSYAVSNAGRLPDPTSLETTWESLLRPYLPSVDAFRCPADGEVFPSLNSSYDWRDGGEPETSAAGRPLAACRADAVLAFDVFPRWHGARSMNAVRVDGSALSMDEQECLRDLLREVTTGGTGNDGH